MLQKEKELAELERKYKLLQEEIKKEKEAIRAEKKLAEQEENYKRDYLLVKEAIEKQCYKSMPPSYYATINGKVFYTNNDNALFESEGKVIGAIKTSISLPRNETIARNKNKAINELKENGIIVIKKLIPEI